MPLVFMSIPLVQLAFEVCIKSFCLMEIIKIDGISVRICCCYWYNALCWFSFCALLDSFLFILAFCSLWLFEV